MFCSGNVLGWSLFLVVVSFWPLSWLGFFLPKLLVACLGLVLSVISIFLNKKSEEKVCVSKMIYLVLGYFLLLLLCTIFSVAPWSSFWGVSQSMQGLLVNLVYAALFFVALMLRQDEWPKVWRAIIWANVFVVIYGVMQLLHLDPLARYWDLDYILGRPFSTLGNPNWLASFLLLTLPVVYVGLLKDGFDVVRSSIQKYCGIFLVVVNILLIFMTASKAGIIGLLVLGLGFLWINGKRKMLWLMVGGVTVVSVFILQYFYSDSFALLRSTSGRMIIWTQTVKMLSNWPWGHGLDVFRYVFPQWNVAAVWQYEDLANTIDNPHSQLLNLFVQGGLVLAVLFYLMVAKIIWPQLQKNNFLAWGLLAYLVSNLFGFEVLPNGLLFWLVLAYLLSKNAIKRNAFSGFHKILLSIICVVCLSFGWLTFQHLRADFVYEKSLRALTSGNYVQAVNYSYEATQIFPYDRVLLLQASEMILAIDKPELSLLKQVDDYLRQLDVLSSGKDPDVPVLRAWLAAKMGDSTMMEEQLAIAKALNPAVVNTYKIAIQIYRELGDEQSEKREIENLKKLLPTYWNQPQTEPGRIFQKNYPWLLKLIE